MTVSSSASKCNCCSIAQLCQGVAVQQRQPLAERQLKLKSQQQLIAANSSFNNLFVIRVGALKAWELEAEGREHIINFYLPGEVVGLEAIHSGKYPAVISAIGDTELCQISFPKLLFWISQSVEFLKILLAVSSSWLNVGNYRSKLGATQKLAAFLLEIKQRSQKDLSVKLPMSRVDIANYLGLATETVVRLFSQWQKMGLISINKRHITILNLQQLQLLSQTLI